MTKENEVSAPALREAVRAAEDMRETICEMVSRATYEAEELGQGDARLVKLAHNLDDWMRNGVFASYRDQFQEALSQSPAPQDVSAPALSESPNIQGGGLDSGWRTMESAPRDGTVVDLWMGADEFPHRVTDAKWCKPEHTCAGPNCDMCPGDVDEYAWREALTGYEYAIGTLAGPTHWRPPLPPTAPNTTATSNVTGADASDEDAEDLATAEASYAEYQENGGVTLDELKAELDAADSRDALIEELRGALGGLLRADSLCDAAEIKNNGTASAAEDLQNAHRLRREAMGAAKSALSHTGREG